MSGVETFVTAHVESVVVVFCARATGVNFTFGRLFVVLIPVIRLLTCARFYVKMSHI